MADSTTNLDVLSAGQLSKEVTANALSDAASWALTYGRRASTCALLVWGFYGGKTLIAGVPTKVYVLGGTPNTDGGLLTLTASSTNYIRKLDSTGAVSFVTSAPSGWPGPSGGYTALYEVVTGAATVTSYTDWRTAGVSQSSGVSPAVVDKQVFTADGTWTKPAGVTAVRVIAVGGGGGGGAGRGDAAGTVRFGASAGGGGLYIDRLFAASDLTSTVAVTVPAVAAGGTGVAGADGNAGSDGGAVLFGAYLTAFGGGRGGGGLGSLVSSGGGGGGGTGSVGGPGTTNTVVGGEPQTVANVRGISGQGGGSTGAANSPPAEYGGAAGGGNGNTSGNNGGSSIFGAPGGGAGGAITAGNSDGAGGPGGVSHSVFSGGGGAGGAAGGTAGAAGTAGNSTICGFGGGGGGGNAGGTGGVGGAGGVVGGGGGGGGGGTNTGGAGGAGGKGQLWVISW